MLAAFKHLACMLGVSVFEIWIYWQIFSQIFWRILWQIFWRKLYKCAVTYWMLAAFKPLACMLGVSVFETSSLMKSFDDASFGCLDVPWYNNDLAIAHQFFLKWHLLSKFGINPNWHELRKQEKCSFSATKEQFL